MYIHPWNSMLHAIVSGPLPILFLMCFFKYFSSTQRGTWTTKQWWFGAQELQRRVWRPSCAFTKWRHHWQKLCSLRRSDCLCLLISKRCEPTTHKPPKTISDRLCEIHKKNNTTKRDKGRRRTVFTSRSTNKSLLISLKCGAD